MSVRHYLYPAAKRHPRTQGAGYCRCRVRTIYTLLLSGTQDPNAEMAAEPKPVLAATDRQPAVAVVRCPKSTPKPRCRTAADPLRRRQRDQASAGSEQAATAAETMQASAGSEQAAKAAETKPVLAASKLQGGRDQASAGSEQAARRQTKSLPPASRSAAASTVVGCPTKQAPAQCRAAASLLRRQQTPSKRRQRQPVSCRRRRRLAALQSRSPTQAGGDSQPADGPLHTTNPLHTTC